MHLVGARGLSSLKQGRHFLSQHRVHLHHHVFFFGQSIEDGGGGIKGNFAPSLGRCSPFSPDILRHDLTVDTNILELHVVHIFDHVRIRDIIEFTIFQDNVGGR